MTGKITLLNLDSFVLKQLAKLLNLFLELSDEFRVGIFVNNSFADNRLGSVSVSVNDGNEFY